MNNQTNINIRTDLDVKNNAERIFESLGLNMSVAINIFLRQAIRKGGLPFEVITEIPNDLTKASFEEGKALMHDKNAKGCKDLNELKKALDI